MYDIKKIGRLHIELSSRCNASCPACSRNLAGGPVSPKLQVTELKLEDIKKFFPVNIIKNLSGINFCGNLGDPGMATDLLPILEYFQHNNENNIAQQVRTNGGMRTSEFWNEVGKFFAAIPRSDKNHVFFQPAVVFSVDGLEDTNHIYRRGVRWEKVIANMEAYSSAGAFGIWEFLVFEHNQHQIDEARKLAEKLGFFFSLKNPMGFGEYQGKQQPMNVFSKTGAYEYSVYPANFQGERANFPEGYSVDFNSSVEENPQLTEFSKSLANTTVIHCKSLENKEVQEIYVSASGHLLPCCFLGGVFGQFNSTYSRWQFNSKINEVGTDKINLRKNTIEEILTSNYFSNFFLQGWERKSVEEGRLLFCAETCGSISAIDKLYKTKTLDLITLNKRPV
jgi:MoaA/NifB/PqqE/SkfB family radical SAM enzyme